MFIEGKDKMISLNKKARKLNREQTMLAEEKRVRLKEAFSRYLADLPEEKKKELVDVSVNVYQYTETTLEFSICSSTYNSVD